MSASHHLLNSKIKQQYSSHSHRQLPQSSFAPCAQFSSSQDSTSSSSNLNWQRSHSNSEEIVPNIQCEQYEEIQKQSLISEKIIMHQAKRQVIHEEEEQVDDKRVEKLFQKANTKQITIEQVVEDEIRVKAIKYSNSTGVNINSQGPEINQNNNILNQNKNYGFSQNQEHAKFYHDSQYFQLKSCFERADTQRGSNKKRRPGTGSDGRTQQGIQIYTTNNKIPLIQEWFSKLTQDERVLCLTSVDKHATDSIIRMKKKLEKHGNGNFALKTRVITQRQLPVQNCTQKQEENQQTIKQDYCLVSMKELMKQANYRDDPMQSSKLIQEKELLEYIRITETFEENDTLTIASSLVSDPNKFLSLLSSIVGQNFLKIPYETIWDVEKRCFLTISPVWFQPQSLNSLAAWIIYYLERSMWIQYSANIRGDIFNNHYISKEAVFIEPEGHLINVKTDLSEFWAELQGKIEKEPKIMQLIEDELESRVYEKFKYQGTYGFGCINNLNGGIYTSDNNSVQDNINSYKSIISILQREQDPQKFLQNLGMVSLDRLRNYDHYQMEKILIQILREKKLSGLQKNINAQTLKNQKKKLKRKQKQQLQQQNNVSVTSNTSFTNTNNEHPALISSQLFADQLQSNINQMMTSQSNIESFNKSTFKVNDELLQLMKAEKDSQSSDESDDNNCDLDNIIEQPFDFFSNEEFFKRKSQPTIFSMTQANIKDNSAKLAIPGKFQRSNEGINDLLCELLDQKPKAEMIKVSKPSKPILKLINLPKGVYEEYRFDIEFEDMRAEENEIKDKSDSKSKKEVISATSESTDDQQEILSQELIISKSQSTPQSQPKAEIEEDLQINVDEDSIQLPVQGYTPNSNNEDGHYEQSQQLQREQLVTKSPISPSKFLSSPQIKYKKKDPGHNSQETKQQQDKLDDQSSSSNEEPEPESNFLIIRSNQSFIPSNNSSHHNKKKKKTRSKPVLLAQKQTQVFKEQSYKLNSFMRNVISDDGHYEDSDDFTKTNTCSSKNKMGNKQTSDGGIVLQRNAGDVKQMYVKKSQSIEDNTFDHQKHISPSFYQKKEQSYIDNQIKAVSMEESKISFSKKEKSCQETNELELVKKVQRQFSDAKEKYQSQDLKDKNSQSKRFDSFINQKEISTTQSMRSNEDNKFMGRGMKTLQNIRKSSNWGGNNNNNNKKSKKKARSPNIEMHNQSNGNQSYLNQSQVSSNNNFHIGAGQGMTQGDQFQLYPQMTDQSNPLIDQIQQLLTNVMAASQQQYYPIGYNQYDPIIDPLQYNQDCMQMMPQQQWINNAAIQDPLLQQQQQQIYNNCGDSSSMDQEGHDDSTEIFFDIMETQMIKFEKDIDKKLNSVRKEREQVISIIQETINKTYNNTPQLPPNNHKHHNTYNQVQRNFVGIKMYGSMASGLAIDSSDVDLAVTGLNFNGNREMHLHEMDHLQQQLSILGCMQEVKFIDSATIPVIKLQIDLQKISHNIQRSEKQKNGGVSFNPSASPIDDSMRYLYMDITFEDLNPSQLAYDGTGVSRVNLGIECINYIQNLSMKFRDLKQIVMILKKLLQSYDLNQPYLGGLCSYSLVLMTSTFLNQQNTNSMAKNLTEFLNYFGNYFNPKATQLDGNLFYQIFEIRQDPLIVNDPLNLQNNTTRNAFRINEIQEVFRKAHELIVMKLDTFKSQQDQSQIDVIKCLIEPQTLSMVSRK